MSREIKLQILLQNPVHSVLYGLQKGKGADYNIVQPQLGNGQDLNFAFAVQVKQAPNQGISVGGPYVQGPAGSRFVYINFGSYAGQTGGLWNGRMKVPLAKTDFANVISDEGAYCWSCSVPGSTADGKPVFATVKPFGGWTIHKLANALGA